MPQLLLKKRGKVEPLWTILSESDARSASKRGGKRCGRCERVVYYPLYSERCIPCSGKELK